MRKEIGYTLMELLVVLIVISVVSAFVIPMSLGTFSSLDLKTSVKKTAAILRYARSRATTENTFYNVHFDFDTETITMTAALPVDDSEEEDGAGTSSSKAKPETYQLPSGVRLLKCVAGKIKVDSGQFTIRFNPTGNSTGGDIFFIDSRDHQLSISVDFITGTVKYND